MFGVSMLWIFSTEWLYSVRDIFNSNVDFGNNMFLLSTLFQVILKMFCKLGPLYICFLYIQCN